VLLTQPCLDDITLAEADISLAWGEEYHSQVLEILRKHSRLFRKELGMFNDGIEMPIRLLDEADLKGLKQAPYRLSVRDKKGMDSILDPLIDQGQVERVPLGGRSAVASPAFVVWQKNKPRVVVDLRKLNAKLFPIEV
jgi:hypothetical protein